MRLPANDHGLATTSGAGLFTSSRALNFLDLRGLLFQLRCQLRDSGFQFLNFAIEYGLFGGVGNGLGLDAFGRKSARVGSIGDGERAQPSIGIDEHEAAVPAETGVPLMLSIKHLSLTWPKTRAHQTLANDDIIIGGGDTIPGVSA